MPADSVAVLREMLENDLAARKAGRTHMTQGDHDAVAAGLAALSAQGEAHGVAEHGIERASKETLVACDCGCGRSCCANCGTDLGLLAPGGVGDAVTVSSVKPNAALGIADEIAARTGKGEGDV